MEEYIQKGKENIKKKVDFSAFGEESEKKVEI
jgi:hypothetical protein